MKKVSKVFVVVLAMILALAMGITAFADVPAVKQFRKVTYDKTMYTNDKSDGAYDITFAYQYSGTDAPKMLVTSSDRSILRITKIENEGKGGAGTVTVSVLALKDGKATITVADQNNTKKSKKVKVTVKTLQDAVTFGDSVTYVGEKEGVPAYEVTVDAKGKATLGTNVLAASSKKITYRAADSNSKKVAAVTAKGVVTAKQAGTAYYWVEANDVKKVNVGRKLAYITIKVPSTASVKPQIASTKMALKSNLAATNHTEVIKVTNYTDKYDQLVFTSNKPAVAEVAPDGTVTGKSNGKAVITVASKTNSKLSVKVNVTVTTDADVVTTAFKTASIIADGKSSLSILGATNKGASNAKVTYTLSTDNKHFVKKIAGVSVNAKGVVKVKAKNGVPNGVFYVTVTSKANPKLSQTVTINVIESKKASEVIVLNAEGKRANKETIKIVGNDPAVVTFTASTESTDNPAINWTNSKSDVADIKSSDNGKTLTIIAKSVGTTKLTATAADGSKKKTTITLKVTKEAVAAGKIEVYLKEKVTLKGNWTVDNDSKKIVKINKGILTGNKVGEATIYNEKGEAYKVCVGPKPATVQKNVNKILTTTLKAENRDWMGASVAFNEKKSTIDVTVLNPYVDVKELRNTGAASYLPYFMAEADKNGYIPTGINVVLGNGVVMKAQADLDAKTFTAYTKDENGKETNLSVVRTSPTSLRIAEDETADGKVTEWDVNGIEVDKILAKLSIKTVNSVRDLIKNKADYINGMTVTKVGDEPYTYSFNDDKTVVTVYHGSKVIFEETITDGTYDRALEAIKKDASVSVDIEPDIDTDTTLRAWIGQSAKVSFTMDVSGVSYTFTYDMKSTMKASDYDSLVDADIQTLINIAENADVKAVTGIESVDYDPAKNTFEVVAGADLDVKDAYDAIMNKVDAVIADVNGTEVTRTFDELKKVTASVTVPNKDFASKNYEKVKNSDKSIEEFIKEFADMYYGIISGKVSSYAEMDGTVSGFYATFDIGNTSYTQYYEVRFVMASGALKQAYDKAIDTKIASAVEDASKDAALASVGAVNYDAATNTFAATFNTDGTLESYKDSAIFATLKKAVLAAVSKESVEGAKLVVGTSSLDIKLASAETMAQEVYAFLAKEGSKVSDLAEKDITFTVNFVNRDQEAYALTYPIEVAVKDAAKAADVEAAEDVDTEADVTEEVETIDDVIEEVIDTPEVDAEEVAETEEAVTEDVEEVFEEELIEDAE